MASSTRVHRGGRLSWDRVGPRLALILVTMVTVAGCSFGPQGAGGAPAPEATAADGAGTQIPADVPTGPAREPGAAQSGAEPAATEPAATEPAATEPAAPGAPVAPPQGRGNIDEAVPVEEQARLPETDANDTVTVGDRLSFAIALSRTEVQSRFPGEIGGPAVRVDVTASNRAGEPVDLSTVMVTVDDAEGKPLSPLYNTPYAPLLGPLDEGGSATGTYVYTLDEAVTKPLHVHVNAAADQPVAVFVGDLS